MKGLLNKSKIAIYLVILLLAFTICFSSSAHANPAQPTIPYNCTFRISGYPELFNVVNGKVEYYEQAADRVYSFSGDLSVGYDSIEGLMKIDRGSGWTTEEIYKFNFFSEEWRANTGFIHMENSGFFDFTWELVSVGNPVTKPEASSSPADSSVDPDNNGSQAETPLPDIPAVPGDSSDGGDSFTTQPPAEPPSIPTEDSNPVDSPTADNNPPASSTGLSGPGSLFSGYIPNALLPVVAAITTLVTAIGTLGVVSAQGLDLHEIVSDIKEYFGVEEIMDLSPLPTDPDLPVGVGVTDPVPADPLGGHDQLLHEFAEKARRAREQAEREKNAGFDDIAADLEKKAEQYERIVNEIATYSEDFKIILSEPLPDVSESVNNATEKLLSSPELNLVGLTEQEWKTVPIEERKARAISTAEAIKESLGLQGELKYAWTADYPYNGAIDLTTYPPTIYIRTSGYGWDDPESLFNTFAHEIRHWQQHNPDVSLGNEKIDDAVRRNFKYTFNADKDPALYEESVIERDARYFAEQLIEVARRKSNR